MVTVREKAFVSQYIEWKGNEDQGPTDINQCLGGAKMTFIKIQIGRKEQVFGVVGGWVTR